MKHGDLNTQEAARLKILRERVNAAKVPDTVLDKTLNLATWNVRELGKKKRSRAAIHMIAEILTKFDLIAVTEVRDNLADLVRVLDCMGPYWKAVFSDFRSDDAGNSERTAYVYDKRMTVFTGLAAEANPPRKKNKDGVYEVVHEDWWRSPYMASFRAGNFDFIVITAHMRWGKSVKERAKALGFLADWIEERRQSPFVLDKDIIVMGDFNIPSRRSSTYKAISKHGLKAPGALVKVKGTNLTRKNTYDQIMHYPTNDARFTEKGGAIDFYLGNHEALFPGLSKTKFTFQLSDHLPLWIQMDTWIEDEQLDAMLQPD